MKKKVILVFISSFLFVQAHAADSSFETHRAKVDKKIKNCPNEASVLAKEILDSELAGLRWRKAKPSCFESLRLKYVHTIKVPDAHAVGVVAVKRDSLSIEEPRYNKEFYSYDVAFTVENEKGETVKESISFMTNAELGGKKPEQGCALISANPKMAYVYEDCL